MSRKLKRSLAVERFRADLVRIAGIKYGFSMFVIATKCGMPSEQFKVRLSEGTLSLEMRAKVEALFGYNEPIWSTPRELLLRKSCFDRTGTDPAMLSKPEILDFARKHGVSCSTQDSHRALLEAVLDFIAANPARRLA